MSQCGGPFHLHLVNTFIILYQRAAVCNCKRRGEVAVEPFPWESYNFKMNAPRLFCCVHHMVCGLLCLVLGVEPGWGMPASLASCLCILPWEWLCELYWGLLKIK
jgi:hypothetical protein